MKQNKNTCGDNSTGAIKWIPVSDLLLHPDLPLSSRFLLALIRVEKDQVLCSTIPELSKTIIVHPITVIRGLNRLIKSNLITMEPVSTPPLQSQRFLFKYIGS